MAKLDLTKYRFTWFPLSGYKRQRWGWDVEHIPTGTHMILPYSRMRRKLTLSDRRTLANSLRHKL